jgi:hypothetical protein
MPCECPEEDHRLRLFPGCSHWPGERFIVRQALRIYEDQNPGCPPANRELVRIIASIVGYLHIADVMLDNAVNFGTVKVNVDGRIVVGDDIPLLLLL